MHFIDFSDAPILEAVFRLSYVLLKYFILAGLAYGLFYVWQKRHFSRHKIQQKMPRKGSIRSEIYWSTISRLLMGGVILFVLYFSEMTQLYYELETYGSPYLIFSILLLIFLHDAYFYFAHRLMHHPKLYQYFHKVHHQSINPTPWTSFSFQPSEAFIEVAFFPLMLFILPIHPLALLSVVIFQTFFNIYGHAGFELFPKWWVKHSILKYINTSVHHNLHHKEFHYNYGLYFNHWDRIFNTLDPDYEEKFYAMKDRAAVMKEKEFENLAI